MNAHCLLKRHHTHPCVTRGNFKNKYFHHCSLLIVFPNASQHPGRTELSYREMFQWQSYITALFITIPSHLAHGVCVYTLECVCDFDRERKKGRNRHKRDRKTDRKKEIKQYKREIQRGREKEREQEKTEPERKEREKINWSEKIEWPERNCMWQ